MSNGQVPEWASLVDDQADPSRKAYFEVIREGKSTDRVELGGQASIVFGRNPDMTDVLLEHPSISRRHAAVLHDGKGGLSLMDFGSTHGTYLDGQRVVARDATSLQEGSKVRFADSSRTYILRLGGSQSTFPMPAPRAPKQTSMAPPPPPAAGKKSVAAAEKKKEEEKEEKPFDESVRAQLPVSFGGSVKVGGGALSKEEMAKGVAEMMAQIAAQQEEAKKKQGGGGDGGGDGKAQEVDEEDDDDDDDDFGPKPVKGSGGTRKMAVEDDEDGGSKSRKPEEEEEEEKDAVTKYRLPVSHEVSLRGHSKVVTCIGVNNAGNRVAVGSTDYRVLLYDFGGMDRTHKPFRELTADDGNGVVALSFPSTGDRFLCATSSAQPKVFDRDGVMQIQFVKGDPYIADMAQTKGHTRNVTAAQWHPTEKEVVMTAGIDGTIRLWDLNGKTTFDKLINKQVLKARSRRNTSVPITAASFSSNGEWVVAGCEDGSIQGYTLRKKVWVKPDLMIRPGHQESTTVTCVQFSPDGNKIASRAMDDTVKLWDVRKPSAPLVVYQDIMTFLDTSNVAFSPDGKVLCVGTNVRKGEGTGLLKFFDTTTTSAESVAQLGVAPGHSVVSVVWHPRIRQIICGTTGGETKVLYDPLISEKGALMSASRVKRLKDPSDFSSISASAAVGEIHNPNALPMFQKEKTGKRKRDKERMDPLKSKRPDLPVTGPGFAGRVSGSYTFTQLFMKNKIKDTTREQDAREEILKYASKAKEGPQLVGKAYAKSAPAPVFQEKTLEEEMEEREQVEQDILDNK